MYTAHCIYYIPSSNKDLQSPLWIISDYATAQKKCIIFLKSSLPESIIFGTVPLKDHTCISCIYIFLVNKINYNRLSFKFKLFLGHYERKNRDHILLLLFPFLDHLIKIYDLISFSLLTSIMIIVLCYCLSVCVVDIHFVCAHFLYAKLSLKKVLITKMKRKKKKIALKTLLKSYFKLILFMKIIKLYTNNQAIIIKRSQVNTGWLYLFTIFDSSSTSGTNVPIQKINTERKT